VTGGRVTGGAVTGGASTGRRPCGLLVVEDEPVAAQAHQEYVRRVPGFEVLGVAATGAEALRRLGALGPAVQVVLLDMHLPDLHGLEVVQRMRAAGCLADVIAVTSARDLEVIRAAVAQGVVLYLLKPFTFAALRDKLARYLSYRAATSGQTAVGQHEVDRALASLRGTDLSRLPKGMSRDTLDSVVRRLRPESVAGPEADLAAGPEPAAPPAPAAPAPSAGEVAAAIGVSRVTARRYLEHLAGLGLVTRRTRYGAPGRPEVGYLWVG
jgi:response regulator of citrate/malate metabolism